MDAMVFIVDDSTTCFLNLLGEMVRRFKDHPLTILTTSEVAFDPEPASIDARGALEPSTTTWNMLCGLPATGCFAVVVMSSTWSAPHGLLKAASHIVEGCATRRLAMFAHIVTHDGFLIDEALSFANLIRGAVDVCPLVMAMSDHPRMSSYLADSIQNTLDQKPAAFCVSLKKCGRRCSICLNPAAESASPIKLCRTCRDTIIDPAKLCECFVTNNIDMPRKGAVLHKKAMFMRCTGCSKLATHHACGKREALTDAEFHAALGGARYQTAHALVNAVLIGDDGVLQCSTSAFEGRVADPRSSAPAPPEVPSPGAAADMGLGEPDDVQGSERAEVEDEAATGDTDDDSADSDYDGSAIAAASAGAGAGAGSRNTAARPRKRGRYTVDLPRIGDKLLVKWDVEGPEGGKLTQWFPGEVVDGRTHGCVPRPTIYHRLVQWSDGKIDWIDAPARRYGVTWVFASQASQFGIKTSQ